MRTPAGTLESDIAKAPIDILLCATQRCGSTLIMEDMRNTETLGRPEEYFIPWSRSNSNEDWPSKLTTVCQKAKGANGISAIKVMANQLPAIERCLATFIAPTQTSNFPCFATVFAKSRWVWLKRENIVAQAISRNIAMQTGINHATGKAEDSHFAGNLLKGYTSDYNHSVSYDYRSILGEVISISLENLCWQRFFNTVRIDPLVFVYEEVIADPEMTHLDRLAALSDQPPPSNKKERKMVKLANHVNQEWEERFFLDAAKSGFRLNEQLLASL